MNDAAPKLRKLSEALEDHGIEGIELLSAEPSKLIHWFIWLMMALVVTLIGWTFIGQADVIVTAPGTVEPDSEVRRFYAPIQGELVEIFMKEGETVSEGETVALINARGAIEAATNAQSAKIELSQAQRELKKFPEREKLMLMQATALQKKIESAENQYAKALAEGMEKLATSQRAQLQEARANLEKTKQAKQLLANKLAHLEVTFQAGGVARQDVEETRTQYRLASADYNSALAQFGKLESQLSKASSQEKLNLETSGQEITELQIQYDEKLDQIAKEKNKVEITLRIAENKENAARRINFNNIDPNGNLKILAPASGVITEVAFTQPGDKIAANTPLGGIASADSKPVINIEIQEADSAFIKQNQTVKLKFNAFPYQRYGFIDGTLDYVSPATQISPQSKLPVYEGRVSLDRDYFEINGTRYPIRYGMQAIAEIVVRERRLIDLALDPFRNIAG